MLKTKVIMLLALLIFCFSATAHAGWVLKRVETDGVRSATSTLYFDKNKMRSDTDNMPVAVVFNWEVNKMYTLFTQNKQFMEQDLAVMASQLQEQAKLLAQKDANLKYEIKRIDEVRTISGYKCKKAVAMENGKQILEMWYTEDLKDSGLIESFNRFFEIAGVQAGAGDNVLKGMMDISKGGFIIEMTAEARGQIPRIKVTYEKIESRTLDANMFKPPVDFKAMNMQDMMQMMMQQQEMEEGAPMTPAQPR